MSSKYEVRGYRLLIRKKEIKRETDWGFQLSTEGTYQDKLEKSAYNIGEVVGIGHTCFKGSSIKDEEPWCAVGDTIVFSKHADRILPSLNAEDPQMSDLYVINDDDVICVIKENENG